MFKTELPKQDQGFTLIEVLVAILVVAAFVTATMQAMAIALYFKVRAREYTEAIAWIQQDLETQKQKAANYQYATLISPITTTTINTITITLTPNISNGDTIIIGSDNLGSNNTSYTVTNVVSGASTVLTLDQNVATNHLAGEAVAVTTYCGTPTTPATITTGFAFALEGQVIGYTPTSASPIALPYNEQSIFSQKYFTMTRTTTIVNSSPYNQLIVAYQVQPKYNGTTLGSSIATLQTQIIPNAALVCP